MNFYIRLFNYLGFPVQTTCNVDEFQCNNTLCKLISWLCDGEDDCGDNSDENPEMCGMLVIFFKFGKFSKELGDIS